MSCCGASQTAPLTDRHRMRVRYGGGRPVEVKGPVTGTIYRFSGAERVQLLDPRDAVVIARSTMFRAEGLVEVPGPPAHGDGAPAAT